MLLHLATGLIIPFALVLPIVPPRSFLVQAAEIPTQLRIAVMLLFVGSALTIAISIRALHVLQQYSAAAAYWLVTLAVACFALQSVDNAHLLSMLSLSEAYASAGPADASLFRASEITVGALRRWSHYSFLLVVGSWMFLLFGLLYRFRLIPRALAALGLLGTLGQMVGVTLRGLLGYSPETRAAMPLAPAYIAIAVWLMTKGLAERQHPQSAKLTVGP
jgi:hypothetical protein